MSKHHPENREEDFAYQFEEDVKKLLEISQKGQRVDFLQQLKVMKVRMATYEDLMWQPFEKKK